ncbi:uncharacterized protein [Miscanthus floridulus]|uniref:uncharacterized protein n=1 Tax=Miscanthus floridulus TaxID=154761 RepID=UPI00345841E1
MARKDGNGFPNPKECIMIFGGPDAVYSKRQHKRDHPSHVARPECYPLIIDPIIRKKRLTKVLMDEGSGLNILYVDTLDAMHIPRLKLRPTSSPFHDVILGAHAYLLWQIDLPIMFGNRANFRSEVLTFEVVDFLGSYHTILGRPCYAKLMVVPNYTYLDLKMSGPNGVITMGSTFKHAFTCNHEHFKLATTVINSFELPWLGESSTPAILDCNKPTSLMAFHPLEETKAVGTDPTDPTD